MLTFLEVYSKFKKISHFKALHPNFRYGYFSECDFKYNYSWFKGSGTSKKI